MNWKLILLLALLGPVLAFAGNYGLIGFGTEQYVVWAVFLVFSILIGAYAHKQFFLHGFITVILFGILMSAIRLAMLSYYIRRNPDAVDMVENFLHKVNFIRSPGLILSALIILSAMIEGALAWIAGMVLRKKPL
jgi:hypothetical protein